MFRHRQTTGRIADLVGNYLELSPGAVGKFEYGVQEARTAGAVEPRQTADERSRTETENELFTEKFAFAVDGIAAVSDVIFSPRAGVHSGKDIIGGYGDQSHIIFKAYFGDISYFYMISPFSAYAISNNKNMIFEFQVQDNKIIEISSE